MHERLDDIIAGRLARRRRALGLTLKELGQRTGADFRRLHKYETGETRPTPAFLMRLAEALEAPVGYFYGEAAANDFASPTATLPEDADRMLRLYARLDQTARAKLIHFLDAAADQADSSSSAAS